MLSKTLRSQLRKSLPVLFAYIGWSRYYDGTEPIQGGHGFLKAHPRDNTEAVAFSRNRDGVFRCGIGNGQIAYNRLHVVLVARDPADRLRKVVGIYANAEVEADGAWMLATTRHAALIPDGRRPPVVMWPGDQGMRRWAWRAGQPGPAYPALRRQFARLPALTNSRVSSMRSASRGFGDQTFEDIEALEGVAKKRLVVHRKREARLRRAKILSVLQAGQRVRCEVRGCGFDFEKRYGPLGRHYAHVHHTTPLARVGKRGRRVSLTELAIVCANCHAMIHRGGECRPLARLLRER